MVTQTPGRTSCAASGRIKRHEILEYLCVRRKPAALELLFRHSRPSTDDSRVLRSSLSSQISPLIIEDVLLSPLFPTMPSRFLQTAAAAVVLAVSLPVLTFAVFTSITALILVGVRASVLSSEFWISVLVESWSHQQRQVAPRRPALPKEQLSIEFRPPTRSRTNSFVDSKRMSWRSDSHSSLVGTPINRDFEGVGGWRTISTADEKDLWNNMKTRLDRARSSSRHHTRSATGGSLNGTALNSPAEYFPVAMRTPRHRPMTSGSASPQSYFNLPISRSMVSLHPKRMPGHGSGKWDFSRERPESLDLDRETEQIGIAI